MIRIRKTGRRKIVRSIKLPSYHELTNRSCLRTGPVFKILRQWNRNKSPDNIHQRTGQWRDAPHIKRIKSFPYEGKALTPGKVGLPANIEHHAYNSWRAKRCHRARPGETAPLRSSRRGEAHRRIRRYAACGWVGGVYPSAPLTARTAASDGHTASTRAARQRRA